ncbi:hypothetical protein [Myxococcus phage Mx1]|nr:hypothetical protein [Myxococcus phage Mx1]
MTPKEKLVLSIGLAQNPGQCSYLTPIMGEPACVIGQLMVLEGLSTSAIAPLDGMTVGAVMHSAFVEESVKSSLSGHDIGLLSSVQSVWDRTSIDVPREANEDELRTYMLFLVEEYYA